jgi:hypothetical protein
MQSNPSSRLKEKVMEVLKMAFETVIIGLFALPWLWVMVDLVNPHLFHSSFFSHAIAIIPKELRSPAIGLALFSIVYLLGSMTTPVSIEFLNDRDLLGEFLPTEKNIETAAYHSVVSRNDSRGSVPVSVGYWETPNSSDELIHTEFQHDESKLLLQGTDQCARLNRTHEQLTVLQGATFSAFALTVICGFAWCAQFSKRPDEIGWKVFRWQLLRRSIAFVVACGLMLFGVRGLLKDRVALAGGNMPIAELVLFGLGSLGLYVLIGGARSRLKCHGFCCVVGCWLTMLCYTGYGCTQRSYDQEVFSTYQALPGTARGDKTHSPAQPAIEARLSE